MNTEKPKSTDNEENVFMKVVKVLAKIPKMDFALYGIPFQRRLQTFSTLIYLTLMAQSFLLIYVLSYWKYFYYFMALYATYIYFDDTPETGGRSIDWVRRLPYWNYLAEYFPSKIVVEEKLDSTQNYVFGYHPHGIMSVGAFVNFCTEGANVSKVMPDIFIKVLTLNINFWVPFHREYAMAMSAASVSKKSINNILNKGPGHSVLIAIGGAQEALYARPESCDIYLSKRLGFVAMAIKNGAHLVPVYNFGENFVYDQLISEPGTFTHTVQNKMKKVLGWTMPLFFGRGLFIYNYGLLPKRAPMTVLIGKPIKVIKDPNPSDEYVKEIHTQYMNSLKDLYNRNKEKYTPKTEHKIPEMKII